MLEVKQPLNMNRARVDRSVNRTNPEGVHACARAQVRVYALQGDSPGRVLCAKAIRAAHCLTSIQFSPSSQHLLLAYGRCAHVPPSLGPAACMV
jgi:hypothetical protein